MLLVAERGHALGFALERNMAICFPLAYQFVLAVLLLLHAAKVRTAAALAARMHAVRNAALRGISDHAPFCSAPSRWWL